MKKAAAADETLVVDILSRAFDANRSVNDVVLQDGWRTVRIRRLMAYAFRMCRAFGDVWISDDRQACALVLFPDRKRFSLRTMLWDAQLVFSVVGITRVRAVLKREALIKKQHPKQPMAYLWFIGVHPRVQQAGIGSALMRDLIAVCRRQQRPLYLETSMQENLPFYRKHGFEIFHSIQRTYTLYQLRRL